MKVGFVFHKDPFLPQASIDIIRLCTLTEGLRKRGLEADIIAPVEKRAVTAGGVPVYPVRHLLGGTHYDILKTSYHFSIELIGGYQGPVVSRIVRVVDASLPERDAACRERLMRCQETIRARSSVVVLNNTENAQRWHNLYGDAISVTLVPTGCPSIIPRKGKNPYEEDEQVLLFVGSLSSRRMVTMANALAEALAGVARIHYIGLNKGHLYGFGESLALSPLIVRHGEMPEDKIWNFIRHARLGLAIATGPHPFDNDLSKIYSYLRGGLPVLSEERIVNNDLIRATGLGEVFRYDDVDDALKKALLIMTGQHRLGEKRVMSYMARDHSWERRVDQYCSLFSSLHTEGRKTCPY
ncbi:MAG: hypothetical protein PHN75_04955 [Syntrophales bacterium]|nr:hypothetical protein [Syntrophales bacterium]